MKKKRLSKRSLLQELRKLLILPDTKIIKRKLKTHVANSSWDREKDENGQDKPKNIVICIDPRRDNHVSVVIHELLHVYMRTNFKIDKFMIYDLEEEAITAWELFLYNKYLQKPENEALLESWSRAIQRKII